MRKGIKQFLNSEAFIILMMLYTFVNWIFDIDYHITLVIATLLIGIITFTCTDSKALLPVIFSLVFCDIFNFNRNVHNVSGILEKVDFKFVIALGIINILFLLYFYIRQKQMIVKHSLIGLTLVGLTISFFLTDIFVKPAYNFVLIGLLTIVFYFFRQTTNYLSFKSDVLPYFSKTIFFVGILISFQLVADYAINYDFSGTSSFYPALGWGVSNNASLILLLIIPIAAYCLFLEQRAIYLVGILIMLCGNIITLSRGGVLVMPVLITGLIINNYRKYSNRKQFICGLFIVLSFFAILGILFSSEISRILSLLIEDGVSDSGRFELWKKAWEQFINSPLLGGGTVLFPVNGVIWQGWFHSTFFDIIGQLGIVGLIAFITHFTIKYLQVLRDRSVYKWFVLVGFISSGLYALIDVAYFNFNFLLVYVIILATVEYSSGYITYNHND
ncbi:MAG: O-antigen ligase family protein [Bacilli bacterium]|nr:O-antigen ligase family protein [Bacilli bacterium]